jgi:hypothetical protein
MFLLVLRPFKVGDMITVGGVTGDIREIGLFVTALDTLHKARSLLLLLGNGSGRFHLRYGERRPGNGSLQFRLLGLFLFAIASLLSFSHSVLLKRWIG